MYEWLESLVNADSISYTASGGLISSPDIFATGELICGSVVPEHVELGIWESHPPQRERPSYTSNRLRGAKIRQRKGENG